MAVEIVGTDATFVGTGFISTYATENVYANDAGQINVYVNGALQTLGDDYSLNGIGASTGVAIIANFAVGATVYVERVTPITQEVDTQNNETILEDVLDGALDKLTLMMQERTGETARALLVPKGVRPPTLPDLTTAVAGDILVFDGARNLSLLNRLPFIGKFYAGDANGQFTPASGTGADAALRTDLAAGTGNGLVGYIRSALGAVARSIGSKLEDGEVSVFDFMTFAQIVNCRVRLGTIDCTAAINAAFTYATSNGLTVYLPAGVYRVGNLLFGAQNTTSQSPSPLGMRGHSKTASILKASPGLTGTLLKGWTTAGVSYRDFGIDTSGTTAQAWDGRWMLGAGPSVQNVYEHILVTGTATIAALPGQGAKTPQVNLDDCNDSYPNDLVVRVVDGTCATCALSMVQSGGQAGIRDSIWAGGYLRIGAQNAVIDNCWGHGIEFAAGCTNSIEHNGGQVYINPTRGVALWSASYGAAQGLRSYVSKATQFISFTNPVVSVIAYFETNIYTKMQISGALFVGPATVLLGPKTRGDRSVPSIVELNGGTHDGNLVTIADTAPGVYGGNDHGAGVQVAAPDFTNTATGLPVGKMDIRAFVPTVGGNGGAGAGAAYSIQKGSVTRDGRGFATTKLDVAWTGLAGALGSLAINGLFQNLGDQAGVTIGFATGLGASPYIAEYDGFSIVIRKSDGTDLAPPATGRVRLSVTHQIAG